MSKMSQLHATLDEQAAALGFHSLEEACINGCTIDYNSEELVYDKSVDGREQAHEHWLQERERVLKDLQGLLSEYVALADVGSREAVYKKYVIENTIDFIKKGEI